MIAANLCQSVCLTARTPVTKSHTYCPPPLPASLEQFSELSEKRLLGSRPHLPQTKLNSQPWHLFQSLKCCEDKHDSLYVTEGKRRLQVWGTLSPKQQSRGLHLPPRCTHWSSCPGPVLQQLTVRGRHLGLSLLHALLDCASGKLLSLYAALSVRWDDDTDGTKPHGTVTSK